MPFRKGQKKHPKSGRKPGVKNRTTMEIRELARDLLDDDYFDALKFRLKTGTAAVGVETLIHHYAYGRPVERVKFEGDKRLSVEAFRALAGLDDEDDHGGDEPAPPKPKKPPKASTQMRVGALAKKKVLARH